MFYQLTCDGVEGKNRFRFRMDDLENYREEFIGSFYRVRYTFIGAV